MIKLAVPMIHSNGTSADALLEQQCDVRIALHNVLAKMSDAMPHGRDYYPQGEKVLRLAIEQHKLRINIINDLISEYEHITNEMLK